MRKVSLISAVLAAALMFPVEGAAQQAAPRAGARPQLTEAQRDAIRKLHEDQREAGEAARKELRELHAQLAKELSAAQLNTGRVNELKNQIAQKQSAAAAARIDQRAKVAALLTPEQRQGMGRRDERMLERGPRERMNARGPRGMRGPHSMRGHVMPRHGMRRPMRPAGGPGRGDAQLRQRIGTLERELETLERELEALRKKIG